MAEDASASRRSQHPRTTPLRHHGAGFLPLRRFRRNLDAVDERSSYQGNGYFSRVFIDTKIRHPLCSPNFALSFHRWRPHVRILHRSALGDDFHVLWIDPKNPSRMFLGVDQGAILSVDAGKTWSSWYNQPTGQYYHVITDNAFPYRVYAPQQDSGTQSVPSRSDNGEITPQDVTSIGGFEFCYIAPDPLHPNWIYSGGWYGSVVRYDRANGPVATVFEKGDRYRVVQMPPLLFSSPDPNKLYLGTQYVLQTTDQGQLDPVSPISRSGKTSICLKKIPQTTSTSD